MKGFITQSDLLKTPHWTSKRIELFLDPPDEVRTNRHDSRWTEMKLYSAERADKVRMMPEFIEFANKHPRKGGSVVDSRDVSRSAGLRNHISMLESRSGSAWVNHHLCDICKPIANRYNVQPLARFVCSGIAGLNDVIQDIQKFSRVKSAKSNQARTEVVLALQDRIVKIASKVFPTIHITGIKTVASEIVNNKIKNNSWRPKPKPRSKHKV